MPDETVCVAIVTYNSSRYIGRCLETVLRQDGATIDVVVADNASTDGTREILQTFGDRIRVIECPRNLGFAASMNLAIESSTAEWVLTLNPDVLLLPGFIRTLVRAAGADPGAGSVCGKLLRIGPGFRPLAEPQIDSTGIFFTPAMRHFDRGWHQPDQTCSETMEYVFGASAAAALFRRAMIDDVSVEGDFFDPDFFVYREDADVAWRAQILGWRCIYTPAALAYHVRSVTPLNRRSLPAAINMHSVKNRFLMRIKNVTVGIYRRHWLPMTLRDLVVVAGSILWEPSSMVAFWRLAKGFRRAVRQRRVIMSRRRVSDDALSRWFSYQPAAEPIRTIESATPARSVLAPAVSLAGRIT